MQEKMAGVVSNISSKPQQQKIVQDIEECVKDLVEIFQEQSKSPINDDNQTLQRFCAKLEHLFQMDMKDKYSLLGRKKDYWDYFCDSLSKMKGCNDGIKFVKSLGEHKTSVGKGRALIRFSLVHHRLPDSIQQCVANGKVTSDYYFPQSVWLQKDKSSKIISFLYDLNDINFDLSSRGYDLDSAWPSFAKKSGGSFSWNPPSRRDSISSLTSNLTDNTSVLNMSLPVFDTSEVDRLHQDLAFSENTKSDLIEQVEVLQEKKLLSDQSAWVTQGELLVVQDQLHNNLEKMETIQEKYHDLEKRYYDLLKENEKLELELKKNVSLAEEATVNLASETLKYDTELEKHQNDAAKSKSEIDDLKSKHRDAIFEQERIQNNISLELKSAKQELAIEKDLMAKKSEDIQVLEKKLSSMEEHNRELLTKLESVLEEKGTEASSNFDAASKLGNMLDSLKLLQTENTELKASNTQLEIQLSNLQEKLTESKNQREKLSTEISELSSSKVASDALIEEKTMQSQEKYTNALSKIIQCFSDYDDFKHFNAKTDDFNIQDFSQCLQSFLNKAVIEKQNLNQELLELKAVVDQKVIEISDSNDKIDALETEISAKEEISKKQVATKCEEIEELKKCLKDSEDDALKYKTVLENQNKAIVELYKELDTNSQNSVNEKSDSVVILHKVCEEVKTQTSQLEKFKSENTEMSNRLESFRSEETEKDKKIQELMQELSNLEQQHNSEISSKTDQLKSSNDKISSLEESLQKSTNENADLIKNQNLITKELSELKEKCNALSVEKSQLEILLTKSEEHLRKTSSEVVNSKKDLETQIEILKSELVSKTDEVSVLKSQVNVWIDKNTNLTKQIQDIEAKLDASDAIVREFAEKLEKEKNDGEKLLSNLKQQLENEEKLKTEFKEKYEKCDNENESMKSQINDALNEVQVIKNRLQQTSTELEVMSSSKENTEKENSDSKEELQKKIQLYEELQTECDGLKQELEEVNSRNETLSKEKSVFKDEVDGLKAELYETETKVQKLTEESISHTSLIEMMTVQFENQGRELENVSSEKLDLETKLEETKNDLETASAELLDLKSKLSENETELEELQAENKELSECKRQMEKDSVDGNDRVSELEKSRDELQIVVDTQIQEISALQFQLSSEQLQHDQIIKNYKAQSQDQGDLQVQVKEQEQLLESLVKQLNELKENTKEEVLQRESQVDMIKRELQKKGEELDLAHQKKTLTEEQLEQERVERFQLQGELDALSTTVYKGSTEKDDIIRSLQSDNKAMKKRLVKLIKDKDVLWQMTDQLTFEQKQQAGEVWMDSSTVTNCIACKSEFSLFLRKHHCRVCGKIFCYNCSNNWMMTPSSRKKERVCNRCFKRHEMLEDASLNSSVLSNNSLDSDEENELIKSLPLPSKSSSSNDYTGEECSPRISMGSSPGHEFNSDEGAITDNLPAASSPQCIEVHNEDKADQFHVITTEEISRSVSLTQADLMSSSIVADPSIETSSVLLSAEDLIREEVNSQNETTVKPGKKYLVPVKVDTPNTTVFWEFTSKPKDIVFSLKYTANEPSPLGDCEILVEPCKCNSHIEPVDGELLAKEPGIYTFIFDNTYSKLTSKTVHYTLQCKVPSVN